MTGILVEKVLNNNVVIARHPRFDEVVIIGKGLGFGRKKGDILPADLVQKMFVLKNEKEQENYKKLLPSIDETLQLSIIDAIQHITKRVSGTLNEHIHVGLTDHLLFVMNRIQNGVVIKNPFLQETIALYPSEHEIASEVVDLIEKRTGMSLPEDEVGFITLHIHSAAAHKNLSEINRHSQLIFQLISMIEDQLNIQIDKKSVDYMRLIRHLRFAIDRILSEERVEEPEKFGEILKEEYPVCYNLSWKLMKVMQQQLGKPVYDAEAVYLTMHIQRLQKKLK
ncbi:glucose PTS transporter transcription antiterminator GlcT [Bacillus massiliglaciei]|uniref:glucose PTS transporter transcription antiterminator GlcT n=1 Tax=Bacillus massiliglaciei TaxID=1816693 RepID=UPI000AA36421|nr:transcription antiterminator [Bacillus massiliglaciei]